MAHDDLTKGLLIRRKNGTLYFVPDKDLEKFVLPDEYQPGGSEPLQDALDRLPPVFDIKNAIHVGRRSLDGIIDTAQAGDGNASFRPRVVASRLADASKDFDEGQSYRAYVSRTGQTDDGDE